VSGEGKLVRVNLPEGQIQTLCDLPATSRNAFTLGLAWSDAGTVLFSGGERLYQVPASGGMPSAVTDVGIKAAVTWHTSGRSFSRMAGGSFSWYKPETRPTAESTLARWNHRTSGLRPPYGPVWPKLVGDHLLFVRGML
jgi:hypothetical protein